MALADQLAVSILGDIGNLSAGMNKAAAQVGTFGKKVEAVGKKMSSVGKKMSMAITLPLVAFGAMAVKFGSDAEEIQGKFDAVFKQTAGVVTDWIDEFAEQVGRSRTSLKDFAATFQDTFVPLGFAREEAAKLSTRLVELTIDLASFQNMSEPEVMRSLQSAIVGNHETVRRFGVIISQATLDIELMNMGIMDGVKAATEAEKAQARLNLILAGTVDAQGDAIKTAGTFAGRVRALKADFRDLFEELSKHLIPTILKVIEKVREWLGWFKDLDFDTQRMIVTLGLFAAGMGPVLVMVGKLLTSLKAIDALMAGLGGPITIAIAGLGLLAAAYAKMNEKIVDFTSFWREFWNDLKQSVIDAVNTANTFANLMIDGINAVMDVINRLPFVNIGKIRHIAMLDITPVVEANAEVMAELKGIKDGLVTGLSNLGTFTSDELRNIAAAAQTGLSDTATGLEAIGETFHEDIEDLSTTFTEGVDAFAKTVEGGVKKALKAMEEDIEVVKKTLEKAYPAEYFSALSSLKLAGEQITELVGMYAEQPMFFETLGADIGDGLLKIQTGLEETEEGIVRTIETASLKITEDLSLSFTKGMLDLQLKIGDSVFNVTQILSALAPMLATIITALAPIAFLAIGVGIIVLIARNIEKIGEYIKAFLTMIFLPFIIIGKFLQGIISFFTGKSAAAGAAVVPTMQAGGIVPGALGVPRPIIAHGGEPFGAAGLAKVINYEMIGRAVAAGVHDAMMEVLSKDRGRPIIVQMDGVKLAQTSFPYFLGEQERRGGVVLVA